MVVFWRTYGFIVTAVGELFCWMGVVGVMMAVVVGGPMRLDWFGFVYEVDVFGWEGVEYSCHFQLQRIGWEVWILEVEWEGMNALNLKGVYCYGRLLSQEWSSMLLKGLCVEKEISRLVSKRRTHLSYMSA